MFDFSLTAPSYQQSRYSRAVNGGIALVLPPLEVTV